ncbi:MAG: hypothetical protein AAF602_02725, partial [Myxococcota bacterium]
KTGTADQLGIVDEVPYGVEVGDSTLRPHSWFVAIGEPEDAEACGEETADRLAVAVVVPRGGTGASAAGPAALEVLSVARDLGWFGDGR